MENTVNRRVGERVARIRAEMRLTQAALAAELSAHLGREIKPLTVTRLEGGKRPITVDEIVALSSILGVPTADLLTDRELPMGGVRLMSAAQGVVTASNTLAAAIRDWFREHDHLARTVSAEKLDALPAGSRAWVQAILGMSVDDAINQGMEGDSSAAET